MGVLEKTYWEEHADEIIPVKGLTKSAFAQKLGISAQNVKKWQATKDISNLSRIANVLNVDINYLLFGDADEKKDVQGYLEYDGTIRKINSVDDIKQFLTEIGE